MDRQLDPGRHRHPLRDMGRKSGARSRLHLLCGGLKPACDWLDFPGVIARLDPKSGLPDFGTLNDRNRKRPISIGNPVSNSWWLLDRPVNPPIKSGEGDDTTEA